MKIVGIAGSVIGSKTRIAVTEVLKNIREKNPDIEVELIDLGAYRLEFSDGRDFRDYKDDTKDLVEKIMDADAYIIGTPTYQASISGALKNVFDLLPVDAFKDKVVGIVATAGSAKHYLMAEHHLKPILNYMKAVVVPSYVFIEEKDYLNNNIISDDVIFRLSRLADDTVVTMKTVQAILDAEDKKYAF